MDGGLVLALAHGSLRNSLAGGPQGVPSSTHILEALTTAEDKRAGGIWGLWG